MSSLDRASRRVRKERDFRPHAEHYHAARVFYDNASKTERGSALQLQASLVFSAFCVEAYLNHMGAKCLSAWSDIERAPVFAKLRVLMLAFGVQLAGNERPMQTVRQLFRYRDWIAHSKSALITEEIEREGEIDDSLLMATPKHKWERFNTLENAKRAIDDVAALVEALNEKAPVPDRPLVIVTSQATLMLDPQWTLHTFN